MTTRADPLRHLELELRDLEARSLLRVPPEPQGRPNLGATSTAAKTGTPPAASPSPERPAPILLCSNDYLGYSADLWDPVAPTGQASIVSPANPPHLEVAGAGASRLVAGEHVAHVETERELSRWLGCASSLLFSSGYAANLGAIAALAQRGDVIVSDALNHASIIDGCRLSGAHVIVVPHCDAAAVDRALAGARDAHAVSLDGAAGALKPPRTARAIWVVTESYFSMDGDSPDLPALRSVCDAHDAALYVDEAHALGVFGERGRGLCAESGITPDVLVGTFGKSFGLQGAFIAGSDTLRSYLWNRARSFVFSTGISPALSARILTNLRRVIADDPARERLHANAHRLREALRAAGVAVPKNARGPILPWIVGSSAVALALSTRLRDLGVIVQAIRPPTVPPNTARLRITATARLTELDLQRAAEVLATVAARRD